jgi:hypothetical protein
LSNLKFWWYVQQNTSYYYEIPQSTYKKCVACPQKIKFIIRLLDGSKEATQKKVCLLKGANTLYRGYPTEFSPEASKITGLEENSKSLNLKKRSLGKKKVMQIKSLKSLKKPKLLFGSL